MPDCVYNLLYDVFLNLRTLSSVLEQKCRYRIIYNIEPMKEVLKGLFYVMEDNVNLS